MKRTAFLSEAVLRLGMAERVTVITGRAEDVARLPAHRRAYGLVTARSFGSPAVTAECAAGFLRINGRLLVSEPPEPVERWPAEPLALLGLVLREVGGTPRLAVFDAVAPCPDRYPRRSGLPGKRPLW